METTLLVPFINTPTELWSAKYFTIGEDGLPWVNEAWSDLPFAERNEVLVILLGILSNLASKSEAAKQVVNNEAECSECYSVVRATALNDGLCPDCTGDINWGTGAWN